MYKKFPWVNNNTGLLVLRIGVGAIFIMTGWIKFSSMSGTIQYFSSIGFSAFWAYLVATVELLGGIAVLIGLGVYTRISAKLLAIVMLVAIYVLRGNFEMAMTPIIMFFATFALTCTGPGKYSVMKEKN